MQRNEKIDECTASQLTVMLNNIKYRRTNNHIPPIFKQQNKQKETY